MKLGSEGTWLDTDLITGDGGQQEITALRKSERCYGAPYMTPTLLSNFIRAQVLEYQLVVQNTNYFIV